MGAGGGEEKELGVPKERVAGERGQHVPSPSRDVQEEQVVGNSSAPDGNALQVGDSGKERSPLQLVAEEGLTDLYI